MMDDQAPLTETLAETPAEALDTAASQAPPDAPPKIAGDGVGCHAGADQMRAAAEGAGKSELLERYAKDYPQGPHD
ncbi:MAG: chlorophyllide reductase subunit Y, partial [Pseudomonadota bacterium]